VPVKIAFAPDHAPELELMKQLLTVRADGAQSELEGGQIAFAIFTFNGSSGIDDTLLALARGESRSAASSIAVRRDRDGRCRPGSSTRTSSSAFPQAGGPQASRFARCTT
jgi:hypothetical protein